MTTTALVVIDLGTSNRHAYLLNDDGVILEARKDHLGILHVKDGTFDKFFETMLAF